jgi:hypothetical protein
MSLRSSKDDEMSCFRWTWSCLAAGGTLFLVGAAFHILVPTLAPNIPLLFLDDDLFRPWSGWTSTYMALHPFAYGVVFAATFLILRRGTSFPRGIRGGLLFGTGVFLVGSLPVYVLTFASFKVPGEIVVSWVAQSLAQYVLAGVAVGSVADGMTVRLTSELPAPAERVWGLLLRRNTFLYITQRMMSYSDTDRWPETLFSPGIVLTTRVRLFGLGPPSHHEVRVVRVDETERVIETQENGRLVGTWNHQMHVEVLSDAESRYTDRVELRAGLLTPVAWLFAYMFYRGRQRRWLKLLTEPPTVALQSHPPEPAAVPDSDREPSPPPGDS